MAKTLITYFGTYGSTEKFAKDIAELTGGDLFEIEPVKPYDKDTAHYEELAEYAKKKEITMKDQQSRHYQMYQTMIIFLSVIQCGGTHIHKLSEHLLKV